MKALIIGCGYLGERVGRRIVAAGGSVAATTRSAERAAALEAAGFTAHIFDLADEEPAAFEAHPDTVIYCAAPDRGSARSADAARVVFRDGIRRCTELWRERPPGHFVLVSSTGVYAQDDGGWIDETSPTEAKTERQELLLAGERLILDAAPQFPGIVVRLGGLYGPDRSPVDWCRDDAWRRRLAVGTSEAYMNWVHVDDAAQAIVLAAERGAPGEIYLAVDDEPMRRGDFYDFACECAGAPPLEFESDPLRLAKRCSNRKAREELGFRPRYPSYRDGLGAIAKR